MVIHESQESLAIVDIQDSLRLFQELTSGTTGIWNGPLEMAMAIHNPDQTLLLVEWIPLSTGMLKIVQHGKWGQDRGDKLAQSLHSNTIIGYKVNFPPDFQIPVEFSHILNTIEQAHQQSQYTEVDDANQQGESTTPGHPGKGSKSGLKVANQKIELNRNGHGSPNMANEDKVKWTPEMTAHSKGKEHAKGNTVDSVLKSGQVQFFTSN
ncbi:hypothetical protein L210DRAFT_3507614 [Boletus edulis BED1]|uniref:Uncharacterized protein n=1 Tax=Boletus edulis BED1 TaxID=1328754 RepID=A0AAD4G9Z8_BOLED|nr:hypothetical protein L210DRAFT_3507614 [Boletus edulis BED1]